MKRNGKALLATAALCAVAVLIASCSGRRSEQRRIEGDAYFRLDKIVEAKASYEKALEANPQNALAKVGLARCLVAEGQRDQALTMLREAIENDPQLEQGYVMGINILMDRNAADEARGMADQLAGQDPVAGGIMKAQIEYRRGNLSAALDVLTALKNAHPDSAEVRANLASLQLADGRPEAAVAEIEHVFETVETPPQSAWVMRAVVADAQGRASEVLATFEGTDEDDEGDMDMGQRLAKAAALFHTGQFEEAERVARRVIDEEPDNAWANYVRAQCLLARDERGPAVSLLRDAVQSQPKSLQLYRLLHIAQNGSEPVKRTRTITAGVAPAGETDADADWRTLWERGSVVSLLRERERLLAEDDGHELREVLTVAALLAYNMDMARDMAAELPEDNGLVTFLDALSEALSTRKPDVMVEAYRAWDPADDDVVENIVRENVFGFALARGNARAEAVRVLSDAARDWPQSAVSLYTMAQVFREADMPKFAGAAIERIITRYPENLDAHALLYQTFRTGELRTEARRAAEATYVVAPSNRVAIVNLAQAYLDLGSADRARTILTRGLESLPNEGRLCLAQAAVELQTGNAEAAAQHLAKARELGGSEEGGVRLDALIALHQGNWARVRELLERREAKTLSPDRVLVLAAAYVHDDAVAEAGDLLMNDDGRVRTGDLGRIIAAAIGKTVENLPEDEAGLAAIVAEDDDHLKMFARAAAYEASRLFDAAYHEYRNLLDAAPKDQLLLRRTFEALANAHYLGNEEATARALAEQHASDPEAWIGLAAVYEANDDTDSELGALKQAVEVGPEYPRAWFKYADYFDRQNQLDESIKAYRRILEMRPDDIIANNNLAYNLLSLEQNTEEALEAAKKAKEGLPTNASIVHTLGVAQLRAGQLEASYINLLQALRMRPGDPTMLLDYGRVLAAMGRVDEGKGNVRLALTYADQLGLEFSRRAEAEDFLRTP